jgi:hypothetical protein
MKRQQLPRVHLECWQLQHLHYSSLTRAWLAPLCTTILHTFCNRHSDPYLNFSRSTLCNPSLCFPKIHVPAFFSSRSRILTCTSTRCSPRKRDGSVGQCDETLKHFNPHLASHPIHWGLQGSLPMPYVVFILLVQDKALVLYILRH